jgi:hypothetical protein
MPTCLKCAAPFANRVKIRGVIKNISSRRYCLVCSPWGKHNTRKLDALSDSTQKRCASCKGIFPTNVYYLCQDGKRYAYCRSCDRKRVALRHSECKREAVEYKGGKCLLCGYAKYHGALSFHHLDATKKDFSIARSFKFTAELKRELDKCILLCNRCHSEVHGGVSEVPRA